MINTSNKFKKIISNPNSQKEYHVKAKITLNNSDVLEFNENEIWENGISITDSTSSDGNFDIGYCAENKLVLKIYNRDDKYSETMFDNAVVSLQIGLRIDENTIEYVQKGFYVVNLPEKIGLYISLTCFDYMSKLDYPNTVQTTNTRDFVLQICNKCGVSLVSGTIPNIQVKYKEDLTKYTYREILSFVCQCLCCYARFNNMGLLELKWYSGQYDYDGGNLVDYSSGDSLNGGSFTNYNNKPNYDGGSFSDMEKYSTIFYNKNVKLSNSDIKITGVRITYDDVSSFYGLESGYVVEIKDNPLMYNATDSFAGDLGDMLAGLKFRPFEAQTISDPARESGDCIYVADSKGNTYKSYLTKCIYNVMGFSTVSCSAKTNEDNKSTTYSVSTSILNKAETQTSNQISTYDNAVQSINSLATNTMGLFYTEETLSDGSKIAYMHDKPTMAESKTIYKKSANGFFLSQDGGKTYTSGFDMNGNAVLNILSVVGLNADWINAGTINGLKYVANGTVYYKASNYTQADVDRVNNILLGVITPTQEDFLKYDFNGDGYISVADLIYVNKFVNGNQEDISREVRVEVLPGNESTTIAFFEDGVLTTNMGRRGINTGTVYAQKGIFKYSLTTTNDSGKEVSGDTGTFKSSDGKTVTVTKGLVTSIY